jgi:phosphohistidine phosphatase SixA
MRLRVCVILFLLCVFVYVWMFPNVSTTDLATSAPPTEIATTETTRRPPSFQIVIVRHGEALHNLSPDGWKLHDPSLTANGMKQARSIEGTSALRGVEIVLSSPLLRALQTARLAFPRPMRILAVPELQEVLTVPRYRYNQKFFVLTVMTHGSDSILSHLISVIQDLLYLSCNNHSATMMLTGQC